MFSGDKFVPDGHLDNRTITRNEIIALLKCERKKNIKNIFKALRRILKK